MSLRFAALSLLLIASCASPATGESPRSASSGLLANPGMENQPVEAVYFFPARNARIRISSRPTRSTCATPNGIPIRRRALG